MEQGKHIFFTIQHRRTMVNTWGKPDSKLKDVPKKDTWGNCGDDSWGMSMDPKDNPKPAAHAEWFHVYSTTGWHGWWTLKYAIQAMKRVMADDAAGKYDSRDGLSPTGKLMQRVRHEFKIVKHELSYLTSAVTLEDVIAEA